MNIVNNTKNVNRQDQFILHNELIVQRAGLVKDPLQFALSSIARAELDLKTHEVAQKLLAGGWNPYSSDYENADKNLCLFGLLSGKYIIKTKYRSTNILPSVERSNRQKMLDYWRLFSQEHPKSEYFRFMVVSSGRTCPLSELPQRLKDFNYQLGRLIKVARNDYNVEILLTSLENTRSVVDGITHSNLHSNLIYLPNEFLPKQKWNEFTGRIKDIFDGAVYKDCGLLQSADYALKYCIKGDDLDAYTSDELAFLAETFFKKQVVRPANSFRQFRKEMQDNKMKASYLPGDPDKKIKGKYVRCRIQTYESAEDVALSRDADSKSNLAVPDEIALQGDEAIEHYIREQRANEKHAMAMQVSQKDDVLKGEFVDCGQKTEKEVKKNVFVFRTLPQAVFSPMYEPLVGIQNFDPRALDMKDFFKGLNGRRVGYLKSAIARRGLLFSAVKESIDVVSDEERSGIFERCGIPASITLDLRIIILLKEMISIIDTFRNSYDDALSKKDDFSYSYFSGICFDSGIDFFSVVDGTIEESVLAGLIIDKYKHLTFNEKTLKSKCLDSLEKSYDLAVHSLKDSFNLNCAPEDAFEITEEPKIIDYNKDDEFHSLETISKLQTLESFDYLEYRELLKQETEQRFPTSDPAEADFRVSYFNAQYRNEIIEKFVYNHLDLIKDKKRFKFHLDRVNQDLRPDVEHITVDEIEQYVSEILAQAIESLLWEGETDLDDSIIWNRVDDLQYFEFRICDADDDDDCPF